MNKKCLKGKEKEVIGLYPQLSANKIAKKFSCSQNTVLRLLKREGVEIKNQFFYNKRKNLSQENKKKIINLFDVDLISAEKIGKLYGCSSPTIIKLLKEEGVDVSKNHWKKVGNARKGRILTEKQRGNMSKSKLGNKNPQWKEDKVSYKTLHQWVRRHKPKSLFCEKCGNLTNKLDVANISGEYKRDISDFRWLCRRCHMTEDGRFKNLKQYQNKK